MLAKARNRKRERDRLSRLGRLGRLCVCQTKNPMHRWVQHLVINKVLNQTFRNNKIFRCCNKE